MARTSSVHIAAQCLCLCALLVFAEGGKGGKGAGQGGGRAGGGGIDVATVDYCLLWCCSCSMLAVRCLPSSLCPAWSIGGFFGICVLTCLVCRGW